MQSGITQQHSGSKRGGSTTRQNRPLQLVLESLAGAQGIKHKALLTAFCRTAAGLRRVATSASYGG